MTHEEFVHICLKISKGDVTLDIPCCANCKYYQKVFNDFLPAIYTCQRNKAHWIKDMKSEDFCSRWEKSEEVL